MVYTFSMEDTPDVDENASGGKYGYRIGHSDGEYAIPDRVLNSTDDRKVRVITIGAGMSGILMAHLIQRAPGLRTDIRDVHAHAYTYSFALNADWPQYLSGSDDIFRYLSRVVDCFELRKFMRFNSVVQSCVWDDDDGIWNVEIKDALSGETYPDDVEGLENYKGKLFHTARWPDDYGPEQWKNDSVAVLGSGASAIQVVPAMQPYAKNIPCLCIKAMSTASTEQKMARKRFEERMREFITNDKLYNLLLPNFAVGCRRLTPGDPFMRAVQEPNVVLHKGAVTKVSASTVISSNGDKVEVDAIICATGFDVSYVPHYKMQGRNGVSLQDKWAKIPEGYMGLAVPDMPNYFIFQGPTLPVSNGSVLGPLQAVGAYIVQMIQKMQREHIHSFDPRQDVTNAFNHHAQTWIKGTAWADPNCRSWYRNPETGRVNAVWPGSSLHYAAMIETPRYEDCYIKHSNLHNMFAFMGQGFSKNQVLQNGDLSPYITKEGIEKKFYSFAPFPDEEKRVTQRKYKVNDGPKANPVQAPNVIGVAKANGVGH
ncbi:hypothetical protein LTR37_008498 [Vermiconidia calcicola]|uniref:Uncharacterized protein n=1 Tax=Vermiconidia calcicola TaxID=1690605 RepID=A0ACC3NAQ4_9PEZI|nr:hypothetical protein LTR37_008498 [Vermiconidia calcicola]